MAEPYILPKGGTTTTQIWRVKYMHMHISAPKGGVWCTKWVLIKVNLCWMECELRLVPNHMQE